LRGEEIERKRRLRGGDWRLRKLEDEQNRWKTAM
jgi:hypothetical protein